MNWFFAPLLLLNFAIEQLKLKVAGFAVGLQTQIKKFAVLHIAKLWFHFVQICCMAEHNLLGKRGEAAALQFLKLRGMDILHNNWRAGKREIDIIAKDGKHLVFCEVKTRSDDRFGFPEESIGTVKQQHLYEAARFFLEQFPHDGPLRFDVVSVLLNHYSTKIYYCPDAFFPLG